MYWIYCRMKRLLLIFFLVVGASSFSQETFPINGAKDNASVIYAFVNATIYKDYATILKKGTLIVKDEKVVQIGEQINIPKNAIVIDLHGKFIYPSFIDIYTDYGIKLDSKKKPYHGARPIMLSQKKGAYHWNQAIHPEMNSIDQFVSEDKQAEELRKIGFGVVLTHIPNGIARGTGAVVSLADGKENKTVIKEVASAHYSFNKGNSIQDYPGSQMGAIALLRQTYYDADWYKNQKNKKEVNISLESWNNQQSLPQIFEVNTKLEALRALKIAEEFNKEFIIKGSGDEYQRVNELKSKNTKLILPLNFPLPYDIEDPFNARLIKYSQLKHWELAPYNAKILAENGIEFALTSANLKNKSAFLGNLRKSVKNGLEESDALKSLTKIPAEILKLKNVGSLEVGSLANFIITSGNIFEDKSIIHENWIQGEKYTISSERNDKYFGKYLLSYNKNNYQLVLGDKSYMIKSKLIDKNTPEDSLKRSNNPVSFSVQGDFFHISFIDETDSSKIILSGWETEKGFEGKYGINYDHWTANKIGEEIEKKEKKEEKNTKEQIGEIVYPFMAYGWSDKPVKEEFIIKNATIWTNEDEGILKNSSIHVKDGKIVNIGNDLSSSTAVIIDANGKHLTSGIIDEHSHIAISKGVNEGTQASSAEVRIGDVVNSDDINIFRQLAGGVTAAQLLHGSANPIGGQSGIIKLRWGTSPEEMKIKGADGFIKFALGENVKQSNWGDKHKIRFPQTRMGVEAVYYDHFWRAKEYEKEWRTYNSLSKKEKKNAIAPRKDLEMEAVLEILNKKRFISCHSYMQHEINMLMHVADSMGFVVNTFTHILEGYKVADKMKNHGVGASTFSDWWAYKYEVNDAIPYNAAILSKMGIVTAINSDDAEMGRRLNQEAAKTVKYGGLSEEEAWKTVTLNPAKLLHLDDEMGSIKVGKDADLVIWSGNPLSIYSKVEKTYVDGIKYYDILELEKIENNIKSERERIIQKMLKEKKAGKTTQKPSTSKKILYHCDYIGE